MTTKKQEKEQRRQQRLEAEKREAAAQRRRLVLGYAVAGVLGGIVLVAAVILIVGGGDDGDNSFEGADVPESAHVDLVTGTPPKGAVFDEREGTPPPPLAQGDLAIAAEEAGCELNLDLEDEGADHLSPQDDPPKYGTEPPASGDHDAVPAADGAYAKPIEPRYFVHALEHGRIVILYNPKLSETDQLSIKGVFDEDPQGMLLVPYTDMPYDVAAVAWTQMVGCDGYNDSVPDVLRDFRDSYRSQGPENVPL
jgi:hypothetical protein